MPDDAATASAALQLADERMYADKAVARAQQPRPDARRADAAPRRAHPGLARPRRGVGRARRVPSARTSGSTPTSSTSCCGPPSSTTSASSRSPTRSWTSRGRSRRGSGTSCASTPSSASASSTPPPRCGRSRAWSAPATSAGTAAATRTGSAGEAIPLGARIVAVCDAYDAMTSERCYQAARTPAEAIAELARCAGSQFDPAVVEALRRHLASPPDIQPSQQALGIA